MEEKKQDFVTAKNDEAELKGLILFYLDVGQLPPSKAEQLIYRWKEKTERAFGNLPENYKVIWMPVRGQETRVEFLPLF